MADLFGMLTAEKFNFIREAAEKEIDILKANNKSMVSNLQCEIKIKDREVVSVKEELARVKENDDIKKRKDSKTKRRGI